MPAVFSEPSQYVSKCPDLCGLDKMQEMKFKFDIFSSCTFSSGTHWVCI